MICIVKLTHAVRAYLSKYKLLNAKSSVNLLEHDPPIALCVVFGRRGMLILMRVAKDLFMN